MGKEIEWKYQREILIFIHSPDATDQNPQKTQYMNVKSWIPGFRWKTGSRWTQVYHITWSYIKIILISIYELISEFWTFPKVLSPTRTALQLSCSEEATWKRPPFTILQMWNTKSNFRQFDGAAYNFTCTSSFVVHQNLH